MALYKYLRDAWKQPKVNLGEIWRERIIGMRKEPVTLVLEHPTRLDRARSLGFKAKQGFIVVRQRVTRGGHTQPDRSGGRRPKRFSHRMDLKKSYQRIAEDRAQKKFKNLAVLNSYWVAEDGKHGWYEVILVDPAHPVIKADPKINWICTKKNQARVYAGKTSAAKKSRGL